MISIVHLRRQEGEQQKEVGGKREWQQRERRCCRMGRRRHDAQPTRNGTLGRQLRYRTSGCTTMQQPGGSRISGQLAATRRQHCCLRVSHSRVLRTPAAMLHCKCPVLLHSGSGALLSSGQQAGCRDGQPGWLQASWAGCQMCSSAALRSRPRPPPTRSPRAGSKKKR